jgi:hypothetical protein
VGATRGHRCRRRPFDRVNGHVPREHRKTQWPRRWCIYDVSCARNVITEEYLHTACRYIACTHNNRNNSYGKTSAAEKGARRIGHAASEHQYYPFGAGSCIFISLLTSQTVLCVLEKKICVHAVCHRRRSRRHHQLTGQVFSFYFFLSYRLSRTRMRAHGNDYTVMNKYNSWLLGDENIKKNISLGEANTVKRKPSLIKNAHCASIWTWRETMKISNRLIYHVPSLNGSA